MVCQFLPYLINQKTKQKSAREASLTRALKGLPRTKSEVTRELLAYIPKESTDNNSN